MDANNKEFHVGDRVFSFTDGIGVVESISIVSDLPYPVRVRWEKTKETSYYTEDGKYYEDDSRPDRNIYSLEKPKVSGDSIENGIVQRMMNALDKKTEDAINPSHYQIEGIPEAYEIINHLMHREQYEGFLWGNIIKYAYRYGRKGDKAETAGKIAWYANKLKELEEGEQDET